MDYNAYFNQQNQSNMMYSQYFNPSFPYNNSPYDSRYMNFSYTFEDPVNYSQYYYPISSETDYGANAGEVWQEKQGKHQSPFIQYFQGQNGEIDIDKVFGTVNQAIRTVQQVGPIVRSVNNFVKNLK